MKLARVAPSLARLSIGISSLFASGCSSVTEPLRHVEPMDRKLGEVRERMAVVQTIESEIAAMGSTMTVLDRRLSELATIDSGVARTSASVTALQEIFPRLDVIQDRLAHVATNEEVVKVEARLAEQLAALADTKAELAGMNARLADTKAELVAANAKLAALPELVTEIRSVNREIGALGSVAREAHAEAREVLGSRTAVLGIVAFALGLHAFLHWRLRASLAANPRAAT